MADPVQTVPTVAAGGNDANPVVDRAAQSAAITTAVNAFVAGLGGAYDVDAIITNIPMNWTVITEQGKITLLAIAVRVAYAGPVGLNKEIDYPRVTGGLATLKGSIRGIIGANASSSSWRDFVTRVAVAAENAPPQVLAALHGGTYYTEHHTFWPRGDSTRR